MMLNSMDFEVITNKDLLGNDLGNFIDFDASDYGYNGSVKYLLVIRIYPIFSK